MTPPRLDPNCQNGAMGTVTNLSSTRRMVRAMRQSERLTESNIALGTLAVSTARALDEALVSGERRYVVDRLARVHLAALQALEQLPGSDTPDPFAELLRELSVPTPGTPDTPSDRL